MPKEVDNLSNVSGKLVGDPNIEEKTNSKTGAKFKTASFTLAVKDGVKTKYINFQATGKKAYDFEKASRGDDIQVKGEIKSYTTRNGEEKSYIQVAEAMVTPAQRDLTVSGNLVGDPEIGTRTTSDGKEFQYANFSIAENVKGQEEPRYYSCQMTGNKVNDIKHWQKGDFVEIKGNFKNHEYENEQGEKQIKETVKVLNTKDLKVKNPKEKEKSFVKEMIEYDKEAKEKNSEVRETKNMDKEI